MLILTKIILENVISTDVAKAHFAGEWVEGSPKVTKQVFS